MTSLAPLAAGACVAGRYEVIRCIKAGGMGAVYEVTDRTTRRLRAMKTLLPELCADAEQRERFEHEATVAAAIRSDHVVETFDAGIDAATGTPFLVMELLRGRELAEVVREKQRLDATEAIDVLAQVALAVDKTHAAGVVHRDLKPENLFVTRRDDGSSCVKIIDFGIAKVVCVDAVHTTKSIGTPFYMPPEQLTGDGRIGPAADLYALAQVAFTLLVGRPYWRADAGDASTMFPMLARIAAGAREPATLVAERDGVELPEGFDAWFARATSVRAAARFPRATDQIRDLAAVLGVATPAVLDAEVSRAAPDAREDEPDRPDGGPTRSSLTMTPSAAHVRPAGEARRRRLATRAIAAAALAGAAAYVGWRAMAIPSVSSAPASEKPPAAPRQLEALEGGPGRQEHDDVPTGPTAPPAAASVVAASRPAAIAHASHEPAPPRGSAAHVAPAGSDASAQSVSSAPAASSSSDVRSRVDLGF